MRLVATLIVGIVLGYLLQPEPHTETVTVIQTETIVEQVPAKAIDVLNLLRRLDIKPDPDQDDETNAQCAYALQRMTDEPLQGIINYVERQYQGDSCAAYQHQATYGYY
jgi:hypothetical protein